MDLTLHVDGVTRLNIRVAILIQTNKGYLFEKHSDGYYYTIGGRVKLNESSLQAAQREVEEEIGFDIGTNVELVAVIENFFGTDDKRMHEICFVYEYEGVIEVEVSDVFLEIKKEDIEAYDIRPEIIKKILTDQKNGFCNYIVE